MWMSFLISITVARVRLLFPSASLTHPPPAQHAHTHTFFNLTHTQKVDVGSVLMLEQCPLLTLKSASKADGWTCPSLMRVCVCPKSLTQSLNEMYIKLSSRKGLSQWNKLTFLITFGKTACSVISCEKYSTQQVLERCLPTGLAHKVYISHY